MEENLTEDKKIDNKSKDKWFSCESSHWNQFSQKSICKVTETILSGLKYIKNLL